jgi:hypothetical protein
VTSEWVAPELTNVPPGLQKCNVQVTSRNAALELARVEGGQPLEVAEAHTEYMTAGAEAGQTLRKKVRTIVRSEPSLIPLAGPPRHPDHESALEPTDAP